MNVKRNLNKSIDGIIQTLTHSLANTFNEDYIISPESRKVIKTSIDSDRMDEVVERLKNSKEEKTEKIVLSDGRNIVITVE